MDLSMHKREEVNDGLPAKKPHIDEKQGQSNQNGSEASKGGDVEHGFRDLSGFQLKNILSNGADVKRLVVEGTFKDGQTAVVILDKKPFSEEHFSELFSSGSKLSRLFQNDIYGNYDCLPGEKAAAIKATIVYPATPKHVEKYMQHELFLVEETPEIYEKVTLPHINNAQFSLQWVYNILEHKQEADRIVYEEKDPKTGFILLPDLKWDGKTLENLYLTVIVHAKNIKSLRDLTDEHLPLLKNILEKASIAVKDKYGLSKSKLRIYLHYQPSYYHLHAHVTSLSYNAPGIYTEKSHLLQTVISNIERNSKHYQEATLPFAVKKNDPLYAKLEEFGYQF